MLAGLLSKAEAARRLDVSEPTLRKMLRAGELPVVRVADREYLHAEAVDAYRAAKLGAGVALRLLTDLLSTPEGLDVLTRLVTDAGTHTTGEDGR
jgi:excisionase family DNA binding protein